MDYNSYKTIAVVGLSDKPNRPSYHVARYLQEEGFRIIPVNPGLKTEVLGEKPYPDLLSIPEDIKIDIVDIFRKAEDVPPIVEQAKSRGAKVIWMQESIVNEEAAQAAREAGMDVVMDKCILKEHMAWKKQSQ